MAQWCHDEAWIRISFGLVDVSGSNQAFHDVALVARPLIRRVSVTGRRKASAGAVGGYE